jgi:hypothetical protein
MLDQIEERTGELPSVLLADGNHASHDCIHDADARGVTTLIAVPKRKGSASGRRRENDDPAILAWKARMDTDEAKALYRARASLCALPNAHFKSRLGLGQLLVRSLPMVTSVALPRGALGEHPRARERATHLTRGVAGTARHSRLARTRAPARSRLDPEIAGHGHVYGTRIHGHVFRRRTTHSASSHAGVGAIVTSVGNPVSTIPAGKPAIERWSRNMRCFRALASVGRPR